MVNYLENRIIDNGFEKLSSAPKIMSGLSSFGRAIKSPESHRAALKYVKSMASKQSLNQTKNIYGGYLDILKKAPSTLYSQGFKDGGRSLGSMYINNFKNNPVGVPLALVLPKLTVYPAAGYVATKLYGKKDQQA
jgi:hypothetical protein